MLPIVRIVTHADDSCVDRTFIGVCLFVCLSVFPHDISKTDATRIAELVIDMFHGESGKSIYFGVKGSKVEVTRHKNSAYMGYCALVSAGFF